MARIARETLRVTQENGAQLLVQAGETIPAWAKDQITNSAAYVEAPEAAAVEGEGVDYEAMTVTDLRKEIESRNEAGADLSTDGKKADLIEALTAHDARS